MHDKITSFILIIQLNTSTCPCWPHCPCSGNIIYKKLSSKTASKSPAREICIVTRQQEQEKEEQEQEQQQQQEEE
ncbi:hypothetical protein AWZ03_004688 [Drosophila navojoa]|uniref:Uncharacterized protein n=1 Tax=Drosophila navojoa TaxID=7232 RepID=A0A484BLR8_DRONA|nr:hypothetical protein AWZ03_004688 [Drosophila navojoa]